MNKINKIEELFLESIKVKQDTINDKLLNSIACMADVAADAIKKVEK